MHDVMESVLTTKQFATKYMDVPLHELVRGEVIRLMPGGLDHSVVVAKIVFLLGVWAGRTKRGRVLGGEAGLVTAHDPDTVRGVDVSYLSYARLPKSRRSSSFLAVPPELVVDVIGKGQGWDHMVEKAGEYLRMGVDRVWVVDPRTRRVHVFRTDAPPVEIRGNAIVRDEAILPGFSCRVAEFFQD